MYLNRLPALQARLHAYQEKTRNLELVWHEPAPVPTPQRSKLFDYYFTCGKFDVEERGTHSTSLAVFTRNPHKVINLEDPQGFMLIQAPFGTMDDLLVIFASHIHDDHMVTMPGGIQVIRGVQPELPWAKRDAKKFNFLLNKEIARLFFLAVQASQFRSITNTEVRLSYLEHANLEH